MKSHYRFVLFFVQCLLIGLIGITCVYSKTAFADEEASFPADQLEHHDESGMEWWNLPNITLSATKGDQAEVQGDGRILLNVHHRSPHIQVGQLKLNIAAESVLIIDQVDQEVRVMVLFGSAEALDGHRKLELPLSYQCVLSPLTPSDDFIDDGISRRPVSSKYEDKDHKTFIRQFYLEQVIYTHPILRTLNEKGGDTKKMVEKLNKTGAIIRDINGSDSYDANQV